jgi:hypothetical protein
MPGYRQDDDWSTNDGQGSSRLFGILIAFPVGLAVALIAGQFASDGAAELAGVMAGSLVACLQAFWGYRGKRWFVPLVSIWVALNLAILAFVVPMKIQASRGIVQLAWLEFFAFFGLLWAATRVWGDSPD